MLWYEGMCIWQSGRGSGKGNRTKIFSLDFSLSGWLWVIRKITDTSSSSSPLQVAPGLVSRFWCFPSVIFSYYDTSSFLFKSCSKEKFIYLLLAVGIMVWFVLVCLQVQISSFFYKMAFKVLLSPYLSFLSVVGGFLFLFDSGWRLS